MVFGLHHLTDPDEKKIKKGTLMHVGRESWPLWSEPSDGQLNHGALEEGELV